MLKRTHLISQPEHDHPLVLESEPTDELALANRQRHEEEKDERRARLMRTLVFAGFGALILYGLLGLLA